MPKEHHPGHRPSTLPGTADPELQPNAWPAAEVWGDAPASEADMRGVQNARRALDHIEQSLGPLLELDRKQVVSSLTPLENAELRQRVAALESAAQAAPRKKKGWFG